MTRLIVIAHDIRSTHNVGALLRTADGLGVHHVYFTGYTPYPKVKNDTRLPHVSVKQTEQIHKTALGAENSVPLSRHRNITGLITELKDDGYELVALEQHSKSTKLHNYQPPKKLALLLGREVEGIKPELLELCDEIIEIPMKGRKESLNVTQAAAIAIYTIRQQ